LQFAQFLSLIFTPDFVRLTHSIFRIGFQQGGIVLAMKHWLIFLSWFLAVSLGAPESPAMVGSSPEDTVAQSQDISSFFKAAPSLWENYQEQTPSRRRLPLHGIWKVSCENPELSGEVPIPGAFSFEGQVVFQRAFQVDSTFMNPMGGAKSAAGVASPVRLVIQGAHYETRVEINGELAGSHEGGYTPFAIDLRPERLFYDKENLLTLRVSNQLSPLQTLPAKQRPLGWLNEGGILREIYLEALPEIFIENARLTYDFDQLAVKINSSADVRFPPKMALEAAADVAVMLEIWDVNRLRKLAASAPTPLATSDRLRQTLSLTCQIDQPALWSPDAPHLYASRLLVMQQKVLIDELWKEIGFRKVEMVDRQLHLNGQPFIVRGVNWLENYGNDSALLDTTKALQLLNHVQELGANTIRVVGHPPHPFLPALCDRAGIFVLEELPLYYLTEAHFRQSQFTELTLLQARELILRDINHPSVLGWGLGTNNALLSPEAKNTMSKICQALRQLDNRPIYAVVPLAWISDWEPLVDFLLPDIFQHEEVTRFAEAATTSRRPLLPIIGAWAAPVGVRGAPNQTAKTSARSNGNAEQRQAERIDNLLDALEEMPGSAGYFVQTIEDWPGRMPLLVLGPISTFPYDGRDLQAEAMRGGKKQGLQKNASFIYPAGLIDSDGQQRMAFQVVQAFNRGDRRPMLITKPLAPVHPQEYPIVGIGVMLIFLFYLNRDRRLRGNMRRIFVHPHGFYVDICENRKVPPFLSTLVGLTESCILTLLLSGFCYAHRESLAFDQFLNLLIDDPTWKARAVWLIWHPGWLIAAGPAGLFALGVATAVFMRLLGFFLGRSLPTIQYFTFVIWTAANFLILGIIAPFFYRLLLFADFIAPLLFIVMSTLLWFMGRFFRGMRVIYTLSIPRTMIIFALLAGGLLVPIALYYDRTQAIFQYAEYHWQMLNAGL
jgi:hypothetical protein